MSRFQKILVIACGYAVVAFVVAKAVGTSVFSDHNLWLEALSWAGIALVVGFIENALGLSFFKKWINKED